jgi:zinc protease
MSASQSRLAANARRDLPGTRLIASCIAVFALFLSVIGPAQAMKIQEITSPGGIKAWLVEEHRVPLMALRFTFEGGNTQDPNGKEGLANFLTSMMDEGAGDLDAQAFQRRVEELAVRFSFEDGRDNLYGSFETLTESRDAAVALMKLAITKPRFDTEAVDRVRSQLVAGLAFAARDPDKVASEKWNAAAFAGHPYGRSANGSAESLKSITRDDLESYRRRVFAKDTLKVVAVGDIDAAGLGRVLDELFGGLPAKAELTPVAKVTLKAAEKLHVIDMNIPQSVARFGLGGIARKDPDFMPAFVLNHIIGGGGFSSTLMQEVREKRGLAYSVYSYLQPYKYGSVFAGGVATKNEAMAQSLDIIKAELKRMADAGPTAAELANGKSYLIGSYALRFDTNAKIANQLLAIQQEDLGIDYVDRRNQEIEKVTLEDLKRVAKRLFVMDDLLVTVVGKPTNLPPKS